VARGALWRFVEAAGGEGTALLVFVVLARLLLPETFGIVALAGVLVGGLQVVVQMGLAEAVVQGQTAGEARLSTAFWCGLALGLTLMALVAAAAVPAALLFAEPDLAPVLASLGLVLPISGAATAFQAILVRRMAFKAIALRSLAATGVGGVAGLALAVAGAGVWALVAQQIIGTLAGLAVLVVSAGWRPGRRFDRAEARSLTDFALPVIGTHLAKYIGKKLDIAIIGIFLTTQAVGHYFLATRLIFALGIATYYTIFALSLPVLSRMLTLPAALAAATRRTLWLTTALCLPAGLGVALIADPLVPLVFGETWRPSVLPLQILACLSIFYGLGLIAGQVLVAAGHPGRFFKLGLVNTALFLVLVSLAAPHGLAAAALAGGLANALMLPVYLRVLAWTVDVTTRHTAREQMPVWGAAAVMVGVVLAIRHWLIDDLAAVPTLAVVILAGVASYAAALWLFAGATLRDLLASLGVGDETDERQRNTARQSP
jgi:O-antigen/teichoic acid export membrane protein